jgi:acylphosphatase
MSALHMMISGRVQGVGFRWSMCAAALEHGARGWVRNRSDGRVEAVVDGSPQVVTAMLRWAHDGPRAARVDQVESRIATAAEVARIGAGFEPLPDAWD